MSKIVANIVAKSLAKILARIVAKIVAKIVVDVFGWQGGLCHGASHWPGVGVWDRARGPESCWVRGRKSGRCIGTWWGRVCCLGTGSGLCVFVAAGAMHFQHKE